MSKKTEPRAADMAAPMSEAAAAAEVKTAVPMEREAKTGPVEIGRASCRERV